MWYLNENPPQERTRSKSGPTMIVLNGCSVPGLVTECLTLVGVVVATLVVAALVVLVVVVVVVETLVWSNKVSRAWEFYTSTPPSWFAAR